MKLPVPESAIKLHLHRSASHEFRLDLSLQVPIQGGWDFHELRNDADYYVVTVPRSNSYGKNREESFHELPEEYLYLYLVGTQGGCRIS